jgi:argininosuccinate lyase
MAKIWEKGYELDSVIERFTVGRDYLLDRRLIAADAVASIAHARMLATINILSHDEADALAGELALIAAEGEAGAFAIARADEDGHTAIEARLTEKLGELGKKIHTGRSRNDQVIASTRLYARDAILSLRGAIYEVAGTLLDFAERESATPMPGRTHLQPAMPSSVGLWAASYAELLLDDDLLLGTAYTLLNRSPLGAAAGYGVPLPLDRELVAELLGFSSVHHNVIAVNNSRGKAEAVLIDALDQIGLSLGRFAEDLILFSMPEFAYFTLPEELCTGSSIMPQKRNPDGMELVRGKAGVLSALSAWTKNAVRGLPSGYNRDVQETKEPMMRAVDLALEMLAVVSRTAGSVTANHDKLSQSFTPELLATDEVFKRVQAGMTFRDAYREVAADLGAVSAEGVDPAQVLARRTSTGTPGNLDLQTVRTEMEARRSAVDSEQARVAAAVTALVGKPVVLFSAPQEEE